MQNKKALVLAVSAALMIPLASHAAKGGGEKEADPDSVVEMYGKLYPEIVRQNGSGATQAGSTVATYAAAPTGAEAIITRNEMESSNSRLGFRGHEKLGGGLRAVWQLETEFHVDSNDSRFAQRDSYVGLKHDRWGLIKLGRFDTPFKEYGDDISFLGVSSGNFTSTSAVYRRFGFGTSNTARFHERAQNAVQYESPDIGGLDFKVQYSTLETDAQQTGGTVRRPHWWSGGAKYEIGNLAFLVGWEQHTDLFGLSNNVPTAMRNLNDVNAHSKDTAVAFAMTYKLGRHQFEFDINKKEWKETGISATGRASEYKNTAYILLWDARWSDQWRTQIHYVKADKGSCSRVNAVCNTDGLEGTQISAGFAYYLSKRTYLFVMGQLLKNGSSAIFASGSQTPAVGEDVKRVAAGINTSF